MSPHSTARTRAAATLSVLALVLVLGAAWGFSAITSPFPASEKPPICTETAVANGERVRPAQVTVSVLNGSGRDGLARLTMEQLVDARFSRGRQVNAPEDTGVRFAQVWTDDPRNPAVRLVLSYLGENARVRRTVPTEPGVNVVLGNQFTGVIPGRKAVSSVLDTTVCVPS